MFYHQKHFLFWLNVNLINAAIRIKTPQFVRNHFIISLPVSCGNALENVLQATPCQAARWVSQIRETKELTCSLFSWELFPTSLDLLSSVWNTVILWRGESSADMTLTCHLYVRMLWLFYRSQMITSTTMSLAFMLIYCCLVGWAQWVCVDGCQFPLSLFGLCGPAEVSYLLQSHLDWRPGRIKLYLAKDLTVSPKLREQGEHICLPLHVCCNTSPYIGT